ncbi:hypothetical protein F5887DRAFT_951687, partial [Amanita rubescens]
NRRCSTFPTTVKTHVLAILLRFFLIRHPSSLSTSHRPAEPTRPGGSFAHVQPMDHRPRRNREGNPPSIVDDLNGS